MTHLGFGHFITISGHFFANYINIFHKTEVLMNIFWSQKYLNFNWIKDYDIKHNFSWFHFFQFCKKKKKKIRPHKWLFYDHFWPFLVRLHQNLSQNCKFLFCLCFSVSQKSKIKNARSYFFEMYVLKKPSLTLFLSELVVYM